MSRNFAPKPARQSALGWLCLAAAIGCGEGSAIPSVEYGSAPPIGRWALEASGGQGQGQAQGGAPASVPSQAGGPALSSAPAATTSPLPTPANAGAGAPPVAVSTPTRSPTAPAFAGAPAPQAGRGPSAGTGAAGAAGVAAGSGGSAAPPATAALTSLNFEVTTAPVGFRYQPKNVGAIWIQDSAGRFVKSLEVWAGIRARYLTKFAAARAGMPVDVTASATLPNHRTHRASWTLKDRSGAAAPPGKYTLFVELTDGDATGKLTSVDFDTSAGPQLINPPDAPSFSTMKLELK